MLYNYNTDQNLQKKLNARNQALPPPLSPNSFNYLRCWRCDYDDADQCVKSFDFTKHKPEACDGKCLKAFEKVEARTKIEIEKAQRNFFFLVKITRIFLMGFNFYNSNAGD